MIDIITDNTIWYVIEVQPKRICMKFLHRLHLWPFFCSFCDADLLCQHSFFLSLRRQRLPVFMFPLCTFDWHWRSSFSSAETSASTLTPGAVSQVSVWLQLSSGHTSRLSAGNTETFMLPFPTCECNSISEVYHERRQMREAQTKAVIWADNYFLSISLESYSALKPFLHHSHLRWTVGLMMLVVFEMQSSFLPL